MRLKDEALQWLHSRPEHIELNIEEFFAEMRKMYDHQQSKLKLRKQFEERKWKNEETFSAYYHEKVILANRVPVVEDELLEYIVEGIPNIHLRNQARLQQFESNAELLKAFENISLTDGKNQERDSKGTGKDHKEARAGKKETAGKEASKEHEATSTKIRCYNCSKYGHISKDCKAPKREKGTCFKCGEKGHSITECKSKTDSDQVNWVNILQVENEFQKVATVKIRDDCGNYEINIDALIDTGSPISFVKEKFIPNCFVKEQNNQTKFCGINGSSLNVVGVVVADIKCDKVIEVGTNIYVVANNTMSASLIIGRDILRNSKVSLTEIEKGVEERDSVEIHNIDICEIVDSIDKKLTPKLLMINK